MKNQHHLSSKIKWPIGIALLMFALAGCEDPVIPPHTLPIDPPTLDGSWLQMPVGVNGGQERVLEFKHLTATSGTGSIYYPDRVNACNGYPEMAQQFEWIDYGGASGRLQLKILNRSDCGTVRDPGYEETVSYILENEILQIFAKEWIRE